MAFRPLERLELQRRAHAWIATSIIVAVVLFVLWSSDQANAVYPDGYGYRHEIVVNDRGWVAWVSDLYSPECSHVFLDTGNKVIKLSDPTTIRDGSPDLSNDTVAWNHWDGQDSEIRTYKAGRTTQITDNDTQDFMPQINNEGTVMWLRRPGGTGPMEIMLRENDRTRSIADNFQSTGWPVLNEHGWVAWKADGVREIFLYNGIETIQITNGKKRKMDPIMNDSGQVVWSQIEGWDTSHTYHNLYLYDSGTTTRLSEEMSTDDIWEYVIGDTVVAWSARDGEGDKEIYAYNGSKTIQLTDNSDYDVSPEINDEGWVSWVGHDGNDSEIFLWDGTSVVQLTDNLVEDLDPKLNNIGWDSGLEAKAAVARAQSAQRPGRLADSGWGDDARPQVNIWPQFVSTKASKTTRFKVKWSAFDPAPLFWQRGAAGMRLGESGVRMHDVWVRPHYSSTWKRLANDTKALAVSFKGRPGTTYSFKIRTADNAGNISRAAIRKTVIPYNEGANVYRRTGFKLYKSDSSRYYQGTVRYSYQRGHTLVYKLENTNGIGLVSTKAPNRGRAKIYVDGRFVKTVDAKASKFKPRQLIFYKGFAKKGTHFLRIENLGTPGRARFDVDAIVAKR